MKFNASLLLLSALGIGGGANPPAIEAQTAGATYPQPSQNVAPIQRAPAEIEAMLPIAGDESPRATSGAGEARYDEVGFASWYGEELGPGARTASGAAFDPAKPIAAHKTLPLGSFVEVTALDSGRTILLEIVDRGPHRADRLVDLSRGAAQQLGTHGAAIAAVRVRQVTPTAQDIAALRLGTSAPTRLDAPDVLLAALRKRLPGKTTSVPSPPVRTSTPPKAAATPPPLKPAAAPSTGRYRVQVATFSTSDRARALAQSIDGSVAASGRLFRVQLGPFATDADAKRARDRVARQGYGDAHVVTTD